MGKGYVEVVRELVGDRGGDVGEEALRVGAERSSSRCELEGGVLAAGEFELVDQVVEEAERVELGFLVGRSDRIGVPPVGVALDGGADERARERAGLGELDAPGELCEQLEQRLERCLGVGCRDRLALDGAAGGFEEVALAVAFVELQPGVAAGGVDVGKWGWARAVGTREVVLDDLALALPPAFAAGDELAAVDRVVEAERRQRRVRVPETQFALITPRPCIRG